MATLSTSIRIATVLLTVGVCSSSVIAQSSARAVPAKRTTIAKSAVVSAKPSTTAGVSSAKPAAVPSQPVASPSVASAAPEPVTAREPIASRSTAGTAQPARSLAATSPSVSGGRNKYLNVGVGLAAYYGGGLPLGASFEVDLKDNISIGGSVDYMRYGYNSGGYKWNYTFVYAGARASYHLAEVLNLADKKFDPYAGATLGLRYAGYSDNYGYDNYVSPYNSGLYLGIHVGARYLFSEKLGGFAEVGYGVSALRLGLTAKF
jgi:hypothetical protein